MAAPLFNARIVMLRVEAQRRNLIVDIGRGFRLSPEMFLAALLDASVAGIRQTEAIPEWTMGTAIDQSTEHLLPASFRNRNRDLQQAAGLIFFQEDPDREAAYANFNRVIDDINVPNVEKIHLFVLGACGADVDYDRTVTFLVRVIDTTGLAISSYNDQLDQHLHVLEDRLRQAQRARELLLQQFYALQQQHMLMQIAIPDFEEDIAALGASDGEHSDTEL